MKCCVVWQLQDAAISNNDGSCVAGCSWYLLPCSICDVCHPAHCWPLITMVAALLLQQNDVHGSVLASPDRHGQLVTSERDSGISPIQGLPMQAMRSAASSLPP
jgi:hypothetical protein